MIFNCLQTLALRFLISHIAKTYGPTGDQVVDEADHVFQYSLQK